MIWGLVILAAAALALWVAFRPAIANHFEYALPTERGLPCRIHYNGRVYSNSEQCGGINRTSWMVWYDARHPGPVGGPCEGPAALKQEVAWPMRKVASIPTLLGAAHALLIPARVPLQATTTVLFIQDGDCYRPYILEGGP